MSLDYSDLGLGSNLFKEPTDEPDIIDPDVQIEDGSVQGIKLMTKSVSLDKLYGQDLIVGGGSNISGSIFVNDTTNTSRISLDATNGLNILDNTNNPVLQAIISGTNVGDVSLGNYAGSSGLFYDKSAGTFAVKGAFTLGSGSVVSGDYITTGTIDASLVNVTNINANNITVNKIQASQMQVGLLSAISANLGDVTVGGNADSLGTLSVRNSSNVEISKLNNSGIIVRNTRGLFFQSTSSSDYFSIQNNASSQAVLTLPYTNQFFIKDAAGTTNLFTTSDTTTYSKHYYQSDDNYIRLNGHTLSLSSDLSSNTGGDSLAIYNDDSGGRHRFVFQFGSSSFAFDRSGSWLHVNGNDKTAIMGTSKGYKALYSVESPEVWFMDFCKGKRVFRPKTWKFWKWIDWEASPDPLFMEVTVAPYVIVPTAINGVVQVWGKRRGHEKKRFEEKTEEEYKKNESFLKMAKVDTTKD